MLRLNQEIERGECAIDRVVGEHDRLRWPGRRAGVDHVRKQPFRRHHERAARPEDFYRLAHRLGAVGGCRYRLRPAAFVDRLHACELRRDSVAASAVPSESVG